ncbi:MAG: hypothetical protein SOV85_01500 [Clostridium sp.]|uniref:hypothetical protein n=1 Tax=Clostridium sp. TaxID=1506 RepID=UPI002A74FB69|nr:hypothetical protein [Clostridium sp.]MDY2630017.1 hypothetical protein [Clostridium sp.]
MGNIENKNLWKFSIIPGIEESTFNKVLEKFYNYGISGLVRENIQNSLDGKIPNSDKPVIVKIETGIIRKEEIPGIDDIIERINCLKGHNSYTKETIEYMQKKMYQNEVSYISFEDANTKGLTGAKNGQSDSKEDTWGVYAYNKGVHSEESDKTIEQSRGGSHGIGKIASNAASDLHIMYFANCDEEGNKHLGGTVQLVEHKYKDNFYRSTGYFTDVKDITDKITKFYPYENNFGQVFSKDSRGLKIIIPFLREQFNNEKEILKSICDSFFIAILQNKLIVDVNGKLIDSDTIKSYINNKEYYKEELSELKTEFTPLYLDTYTKVNPIDLKISDMNKEYIFNLYFVYNEEISKGRVAVVRTIGMKIEDKKITGNVNKPFNAVLIPKSNIEDSFLKSLENESHTELAYEHIKDQKLQKNAKRFINNISKEISKIIENEIKKNNPTDGLIDTKDILYITENEFKKELSKSMSTYKLNNGKKEKTVVKVKPDVDKKNKSKDPIKEPNKKKALKRVKKEKNKENEEEKSGTSKEIRYNTHPDMVERLILTNKEYIKFNFKDIDEMKNVKLCDINLTVVDGMGVECPNEFNLKDNYDGVIDKATGKECKIKDNLIKDVKIDNGVAQIELKLKRNYNKALKFMYYVEV